jgi:spore germination cell wall hydrolase CwlJ-like protein
MINFRRTAFVAAFSLTTLVAVGGAAFAPAFGAEGLSESAGRSQALTLLPESVRAAAAQEGQTPADPMISADSFKPHLPESRISESRADGSAKSLAQLVAANSGTQTASREQECLAGAVYFEAKGEPLDGQLAVAKVILNRARSGRFASSICGVVFQPSQFSFVRGGTFPAIARSSQNWRSAVAIATIAQNDLWHSSVSNALYFHARRVSPSWRVTRIASIGNHIFYR